MVNLKLLLNELKIRKDTFNGPYFIPTAWNYFGFENYKVSGMREGEIDINPYDFIATCIEKLILPSHKTDTNYLMPVGLRDGEKSSDLSKSIIYSMFPRMLTAWDHYEVDSIILGTFLKSICYLPNLKNLGIDILYLMPVFKNSNKYKKGELGSPYSIKNAYKIDENLHDSLLGEYSDQLLDMEFKAFIEACHILGIKVVVDFAFRTVSRDNDLILDHPEWFYWIYLDRNECFKVPYVDEEDVHTLLNDRTLISLYRAGGIKEYLKSFTYPPNEIDEGRWKKLREGYKNTGENILDLIEREFSITTAPGFSNVLNDPQPPWTDATYLKYYFDTNEEVRPYIDNDQPPYILQDGICLSLYHGRDANKELWEYVSGIIPHYQEEFGIDGARIDMGHALPGELNKEIISRAKANNKDFLLWSEEFHPENAIHAKEDGFHFISGLTWSIYKDLEKPCFNGKLLDTLIQSALPLTASMETPDTPRAAFAYKTKERLRLLTFLNCFIPNAVPFINNGFETMEVQPMNLGLENTEEGRFVLDKDDPMYGKLAFFDSYCLHWLNGDGEWMRRVLFESITLRNRFAGIIFKKENFIPIPENEDGKNITILSFHDGGHNKSVFLAANRDFERESIINISEHFPQEITEGHEFINVIYSKDGFNEYCHNIKQSMILSPGEIIIGCF